MAALRLALSAAAVLWLATTAAAQGPLEGFDAQRACAEITQLLARRDVDAAADTAARLMEGRAPDRLREAFGLVRGLGAAQYSDLVYARDYGRTGKDLIYKIDFDKAFLFVRYLFHVNNGSWRLVHIHLKTENEQPFPREWVHIYPR